MIHCDTPFTARLRVAACALITCCLLFAGGPAVARPASAAPGRDPSYSRSAQQIASLHLGLLAVASFDPDDLISDATFTAVDSLSESAIQGFLAAQSGILASYQAPDHNGVTRSASAIIWQAAEAWQISPKVILATLQKEQGLLSTASPDASALEWAMGCGLPDSAYEGFGKQVWYGAESLHNDGQGFYAGIAKVCGDGTVQPVDEASYALYCYTPWIGIDGGGNELFWTLYWQYFGDPLAVAPPAITAFTPTSGPVGTTVTLSGSGFSGATAVTLSGVAVAFSVNSDTQITATVLPGATSGPISITTLGGTTTSSTSFTVIPAPAITALTPTSGPVGSIVVLSGTGFTGATAVSFNGSAARFSVKSDCADHRHGALRRHERPAQRHYRRGHDHQQRRASPSSQRLPSQPSPRPQARWARQ